MFHDWEDICFKQRKKIEELEKELEYLKYIKKEVFDKKKGVE